MLNLTQNRSKSVLKKKVNRMKHLNSYQKLKLSLLKTG